MVTRALRSAVLIYISNPGRHTPCGAWRSGTQSAGHGRSTSPGTISTYLDCGESRSISDVLRSWFELFWSISRLTNSGRLSEAHCRLVVVPSFVRSPSFAILNLRNLEALNSVVVIDKATADAGTSYLHSSKIS